MTAPHATVRRITLLAAALLAALALAAPAAADPRLDRLATVFAMRPATIACHTAAQDAVINEAWGYTNLSWAYAVLDRGLCDAVTAMLDGTAYADWQAALGVLVLVHESYHVRLWPGRADEAQVECRAIRHWRVAMRIAGVDEPTIARLWPYAAWLHFRLAALAPSYNLQGCEIPVPWLTRAQRPQPGR